MDDAPGPDTPIRDPLFQAAEMLESVAANPSPDQQWHAEVRRAIRAGAVAIERHMDLLLSADGMAEEIASEQPRLIHALGELEASHARLLVELWETRQAEPGLAPNGAVVGRLRRLARQMRHVAAQEIDLFYESLNEPAGLD
jgi:hypothetical protein